MIKYYPLERHCNLKCSYSLSEEARDIIFKKIEKKITNEMLKGNIAYEEIKIFR